MRVQSHMTPAWCCVGNAAACLALIDSSGDLSAFFLDGARARKSDVFFAEATTLRDREVNPGLPRDRRKY